MSLSNTQKTGITNLWSSGILPFQEDRIWFFPTFIRINNIEKQ